MSPDTESDQPTRSVTLSVGDVEYRLDRRGPRTVLVLHGAHMRASLELGEDVFAELGCTVLVPSRPGYGRTPAGTGTTPEGFADAVRELCDHLGVTTIAAAVGISAGGPTALALAARHPDLVQRLILESAVGALPWPDRRTLVAATVLFNGMNERATWATLRVVMRVAPGLVLRALLSSASTRPGREVIAALDPDDRHALLALFSRLRSSRGFGNDLRHLRHPTDLLSRVGQPTLVVASPYDGAVPFAQAESFVSGLPRAQAFVSQANSHFLWFGCDRTKISDEIRRFLGGC